MCTDGLIIRQPCSRVAVRRCVDQSQNEVDGSTSAELKICPDSGTENGYTQREVGLQDLHSSPNALSDYLSCRVTKMQCLSLRCGWEASTAKTYRSIDSLEDFLTR